VSPEPSNLREWRCPKCGGDGFVLDETGDATACECRAARLRRVRSSGGSAVIPRKYRVLSFDREPVTHLDREAVRRVRDFIHRLPRHLAAGDGLWFTGDVGTGKTSLAMLVSKAALEEGHSVAIYSVPRLLAEIRDTYDRNPGERSYIEFFERLAAVDLLHLEDVGAEKQSDWVLEQLYSLINERYEQQRSIIVTTNLGLAELEQQIGSRTTSRIVEMCDNPVQLYGDDQRYRDVGEIEALRRHVASRKSA
jgi:DNA replication protein DnaC